MTTCRDLDYEQRNQGSDRFGNQGTKCKNYNLCGLVFPEWWWDSKGSYLCTVCNKDWGRALECKGSVEECSICYTQQTPMKFPAGCDHWFCGRCTRVIVYGDEQAENASPVPFGCPPCPNQCPNPSVGPQCDCEEYEDVMDLWSYEFEEEANAFHDFLDTLVTVTEPTNKCPLCRSSVVSNR